MKVHELMQSKVLSCHSNTDLETVAMLMWNGNCGAIPVVDDSGRPQAMITDRDIAMGAAFNHRPLRDITVEQIRNGFELLSCSTDDDLSAALSIMHAGQIRRLPVVDGQGKLAGIVSMDDLILIAGPKKSNGTAVTYEDVMSTLQYISMPVQPHSDVSSVQ